jgi:hypothetical protein
MLMVDQPWLKPMAFEDRIREVLLLSEAMGLTVLIWGPGPTSEYSQKREKIRNGVKGRFTNADVRFSEELADAIPGGRDLTLPEQELLHLAASDICVVLDTSKGAGEEIAHFVASAYAHKLIILTHEKYQHVSTFPAALRKYGNQLFYSDEEWDLCSLVERVLTRVRQVALAKMGGLRA